MRRNKKGFTLIELLITLAIIGIIIPLIYSIFFVGNKSFNLSKNKVFAQQDARMASTFITNELRNAKEISKYELSETYYSLSYENENLIKTTYINQNVENKLMVSKNLSILKFNYDKNAKPGIINITIEAIEGESNRDKQSKEIKFDILLENSIDYNKLINQDIIYYSKYK